MAYHCVVLNCSNGGYKLKKWRSKLCDIHEGKKEECPCVPPFKLFSFPTEKKDPERRKIWIKNVNRLQHDSKTNLLDPSKDVCVYSKHFINGRPTLQYPLRDKLGLSYR